MNLTLLSVVAGLAAMLVLVNVHEFGHFWVARRLGVRVLRFSFGWGKPVARRIARDGVEYALGPWPVGGYVMMFGESREAVEEARAAGQPTDGAFYLAHPWRRIAIALAGPVANILLAVFLCWLVLVIGTPDLRPVLSQPPPGTPAALAGLEAGDEILRFGDERVPTWTRFHTKLVEKALDHAVVPVVVAGPKGERTVRLDLSKAPADPVKLLDATGLEPWQPVIPPVIDGVAARSPAARAGLLAGDRIVALDATPVADWETFRRYVAARPGKELRLTVSRGGQERVLTATIDQVGEGSAAHGQLGAAGRAPELSAADEARYRTTDRLGPLAAVPEAFRRMTDLTVLTFRLVGRLFTGEISLKNIGGPVQTAQVAGVAASLGLVQFLGFMAFFSVSLAVINLLPVPVLDGGHVVLHSVEWLRGSALPARLDIALRFAGMAFVALLMGLAFYNDFTRG